MLEAVLNSLDLSVVLLTTVGLLSLYWLWSKSRRSYTKYNIPPFPVPPRPIIGHMLLMRGRIREKMKAMREKVGDIFSLDINGDLTIVICGYDNVKEVLVKYADKMPDVPENSFRRKLLGENNKGILGAGGANWKEQRTVSLSILRSFGMGKNILAEKIQEEVAVYVDKLASLQGKPSDIKILTNISVSNVICAIIVGNRFEHDDPYFIRFMGHLNDMVRLTVGVGLLSILPFLYYLPGDLFQAKRFANCVKEVNEMFSMAYINKNKDSFNPHEESANFIVAYLKELKKKQDSGEATLMDEANLKAIIRNLFAAGTETTSTTILWCVLYMLYNPHIQEKVHQEIVSQIGSERAPNIHDKQNLPYLNAVIMETQRLASLVPLGIRRKVTVPFEYKGFTFPEGTTVVPNLDSVLHDKKIWGDPETFRPERFLDKDGNLTHPEEVIPFSIGRRSCLGEAMAKMELFLFLSAMFQKLKFLPADDSGKLPPLEEIQGITSMPQPFEVRFIERQSKDV